MTQRTPPEAPTDQSHKQATKTVHIQGRYAVIVAVISAFGGVAAGAVGVLGGQEKGFVGVPVAPVTVTATATVTETVAPSDPTDGDDAVQPGLESPSSVYLDELDTVEESYDPIDIAFDGTPFPHSLMNPMSGCSEVDQVEWVAPANATALSMDLGVDPSSAEAAAKVTFTVSMDGQKILNETLAVGQHKHVSVQIRGSGRLLFENAIDENRRGNCNTEAKAIWGSAVFEVTS
ncbi:hypothetical protein ACIA03_28665 [Nocardioides sp. NPDC051685]|uniref:hypothetical protein n=1 Tax=Nocardioides sp. NPDC051685 TaxID=3364334 RepID=UPI0037A9B5D5